MHRMTWTCLFAVLASGAQANDTTAALGNSGLTFTKADAIAMRSEELSISRERIRVHYTFFNGSEMPVTTRVAFPLPDLIPDFFFRNASVPTDFTVKVDGQDIAPQLEQKAIGKDGTDRTALLRKLSVDLDFTQPDVEKQLDDLPSIQQSELQHAGLVDIFDTTDPRTKKRFIKPLWIVKAAYHWEQTFPAGRNIAVEHSYRPSVGGQLGVGQHYVASEKTEWSPKDMQRYCMDASFLAAADRARKTGHGNHMPYYEARLDYVLTTGANWAGPIGDFRLIIDKGTTDDLVTFCGDGVKKISPTQFEMRRTDFLPQSDLHILLVVKKIRQ